MHTRSRPSPASMAAFTLMALAVMAFLTSCGSSGPAAAGDIVSSSQDVPPPVALPAVDESDQSTEQDDSETGAETGAETETPGATGTDSDDATDDDADDSPDPGDDPEPTPPSEGGPDDVASPQVPGEPIDFGPGLGTPLQIVGVAHDDVLNFRIAPSPDATILESFPPLHPDLDMFAMGEAWSGPSGIWWKVTVAGTEAWANQSYLGMPATERDVFDQSAEQIQILKFEDVESAALAVADTFGSTEPQSRVEFAAPPLAFDTGTGFAIVDVLDLGDDAQKGWRLKVEVDIVWDEASGEPGAQDVAFVVLTGIDGRPICGRGADGAFCL